MICFPNCKINLGLHILRKLPDGFHELETAFYPLELRDILEIIPSKTGETTLSVTGLTLPGDTRDNLCIRAWQLLSSRTGIPPVSIFLHKIIPAGAGLGGGSSDAAFTLSMLNTMYSLGLSEKELGDLALGLGMDCPFFLLNSPAIATGKGEILNPVPLNLKGMKIVLVKPDIHISTADAYANVTPKPGRTPLQEILMNPAEEWKNILVNDFEESIFRRYPEIEKIKQTLYDTGAVYASMSGSGSAVFGIFRKYPDIQGKFTECYTWVGEI